MTEIKKEYNANGIIYSEKYYKNKKQHREDGPAEIYYYDNGNIWREEYYKNRKYHREDGPAVISYDKDGNIFHDEYWLEGEPLTEEEWFSQLSAENKLKFAFGMNND